MGDLLYLTKELWLKFLEDIKTLKLRKMDHDQLALMFEVTLEMAGRISEVLELEPDDILANGKIRIRNAKGGWKRCECSTWQYRPTRLVNTDKDCKRCQGKGKFRVDQFGWVQPFTLVKLQEQANKTPKGMKLFPITRRQALNYCNQLMSARTHTFRHTWLTWLLETEKLNILDLKQKARHTNVQTTIDYIESNTDLTRKKEQKAMNDI